MGIWWEHENKNLKKKILEINFGTIAKNKLEVNMI
jgi:hypothetical protein